MSGGLAYALAADADAPTSIGVTSPGNIDAVRALDLDGHETRYVTRGFHARLLQHEYDHLDGYLYPMRMVDLSTLGYVSELGTPAYPNLPRDAEDFVDPEPF